MEQIKRIGLVSLASTAVVFICFCKFEGMLHEPYQKATFLKMYALSIFFCYWVASEERDEIIEQDLLSFFGNYLRIGIFMRIML